MHESLQSQQYRSQSPELHPSFVGEIIFFDLSGKYNLFRKPVQLQLNYDYNNPIIFTSSSAGILNLYCLPVCCDGTQKYQYRESGEFDATEKHFSDNSIQE